MTDLSGHSLGRYRILERLGEGGMATVYKAYDSMLEREVAIKIIRREAFPPEILHDVLKRFEREAKALARLSHPNIVKVLDFGEHDGSPFLVLEYLSGGTLKQKIGTTIPWQEAVRLLLPIARGIEYAHRRGVIHRDIKPANILLTEDNEPMLSDFGIAKIFGGEQTTHLTGTGMAIGTPEYMAPEQWTGDTSVQSDIYALGIVLYEMITGRKPYVADTPGGILLKQAIEPLPLPSQFLPDLPAAVEDLLLKVLAKEPKERFANMQVLINAMEDLLASVSLTQPLVSVAASQAPAAPTNVSTLPAIGETILPDEQPVAATLVVDTKIEDKPKGKLEFSRKKILAGTGVLLMIALVIVGLPYIPSMFAAVSPSSSTSTPTKTVTFTPSPSATLTLLPPSATFEPSLTSTQEFTSTATSLPMLAPTASPEEHKLIFSEYSNNAYNYYLINLATGVKEPLSFPSVEWWGNFAVSTSGKMVAFIAGGQIQISDIDLNNLRTIAEHPLGALDPLWSPDGNKIAFTSKRYRASKEDLFVVDIESDAVARLACIGETSPLYSSLRSLAWSPDSKKIAYYLYYYEDRKTGQKTPDEIYISDIECKQVVQIISISGEHDWGASFSWSPDGTRIAYSAYNEIFVSNSDGSNKKQITNNIYEDSKVSWSPDGVKLAYSSYDRINQKMWINIINSDGSDSIKLADGENPIWLSDGKTIAFETSQGISVINVETKEKKNIYSSSNYLMLLWGK